MEKHYLSPSEKFIQEFEHDAIRAYYERLPPAAQKQFEILSLGIDLASACVFIWVKVCNIILRDGEVWFDPADSEKITINRISEMLHLTKKEAKRRLKIAMKN